MIRVRILCSFLLFVVLPLGCRNDAEPALGPVVYDFVDRFAVAEIERHTAVIELRTASGETHLKTGWSVPIRRPNGGAVVRSVGRSSVVDFFQARRGRLRVTLRCRPLRAKTIVLTLNRSRRQDVRLEGGMADYAVDFPKEDVIAGRNTLRLRYEMSGRQRVFRRGMAAVECERLTFSHPERGADREASADLESETITIPASARVEYYLRLGRASALQIDELIPTGRDGFRLRIEMRRAGTEEGEVEIGRLDASGSSQVLPLPERRGEIVRISLSVPDPKGERREGDGLRLVRPRLRERREPSKDAKGAERERRERSVVAEPPHLSPPTNVVVYLVDTLRADHLGCYGYRKPISPNIDAFAEDAVVFRAAIAQSPWTKPSVASLFTGVWPGRHRVIEDGQELPREAVTLAELLEPAGMERAAFVSNGHVSDRLGFDQGFDYFEWVRNEAGRLSPPAHSDTVNARVFRWLNERSSDVPFFLHVHTVDPHSPYAPPPEFYERFAAGVREPEAGSLENLKALRLHRRRPDPRLIADLVDLYDAEIAFNDASFGALVDELKRRDLYDDSLVIFLADHGEAFRDHDTWEHGKELYGEVLDVPLLIKFPARFGIEGGRRVDWLAQQVDVLPTVLETLGLPIPAGMEGIGLLGVLRAEGSASISRPGFAHLDKHGRRRTAVVEGAWKLIRIGSGPSSTFELYDRDRDPGERRNLFRTRPIVAGYLKALLALHERARGPTLDPATRVLDAETRENLRALGYVE